MRSDCARGWHTVARQAALAAFALSAVVCGAPAAPAAPVVTSPSSSTMALQGAAPSEKESRTLAQRKIASQLLFEIYRRRGEIEQKHVPPGETGVKIDADGRAKVDLRADVTPELEKKVSLLGSTILSTSVQYRSIVGWIPLLKLEELAEDPAVRAIVPAAEAMTNGPLK